jgi:aminocarboxymuconate-semialdehyde decarboxylase
VIVDVHSHLFPEVWRSAGRMPADLFDVPALLARQAEAGVELSVISDPHIWYGDLDVAAIERTREYNDFVADLQREHPDQIAGLGSVTPWRGPEHTEEARRAVHELGLRGLAVPTSDGGRYLEAIPAEFWQEVLSLGVPVFLHPGGTVVGQEHMEAYRMGEVCGRPLDMTVTLSRFILWGAFERHGDLELLCAHAGGAICTVAARLDFGHELRDYDPLGPWGEVRLAAPPSTFVERLHLDTVTYGVGPLRLALDTVGARQLYLGSDNPPVPFPLSRSVGLVDALGLDEGERARVMGTNAVELFDLEGVRSA